MHPYYKLYIWYQGLVLKNYFKNAQKRWLCKNGVFMAIMVCICPAYTLSLQKNERKRMKKGAKNGTNSQAAKKDRSHCSKAGCCWSHQDHTPTHVSTPPSLGGDFTHFRTSLTPGIRRAGGLNFRTLTLTLPVTRCHPPERGAGTGPFACGCLQGWWGLTRGTVWRLEWRADCWSRYH